MNWGHKVLIKNCIQIFYSCINNRLIIFLENLAPLSEKSEPLLLLLFFFWEMLMNNQPLIQPLPPGPKKKAKESFEVRTLWWSLWTRLLVTQNFKVRKKKIKYLGISKLQLWVKFDTTLLVRLLLHSEQSTHKFPMES